MPVWNVLEVVDGLSVCASLIFFFQAEDGIRDWSVTGVQTCALPISRTNRTAWFRRFTGIVIGLSSGSLLRSEERRVGKECRSRWAADDKKKAAQESGRTLRR